MEYDLIDSLQGMKCAVGYHWVTSYKTKDNCTPKVRVKSDNHNLGHLRPFYNVIHRDHFLDLSHYGPLRNFDNFGQF